MQSTIVPYQLHRKLPFAITNQLQQLPENVQKDFLREYRKRSKDIVVAYILQLLFPFGFHYLYMNKFILFILYAVTFMGFGLWFFIDLVRMPAMIEAENHRIANECLQEVLYRYEQKNTQDQQVATPQPERLNVNQPHRSVKQEVVNAKPRNLNLNRNPSNLKVEHLKAGYLFDYQMKTWEVKCEYQYDWHDGSTEREFVVVQEHQYQFLNVWSQYSMWNVRLSEEINLYAIEENLDQKIAHQDKPPSVLRYGDLKFYRNQANEGLVFDKSLSDPNVKPYSLIVWNYYDQSRSKVLRIEQRGHGNFTAKLGFMVDTHHFTEILPYRSEI